MGRKAFTLVEMLVGFFLSMFILSAFYLMHSTYQVRLVKMIQKARGQQAVRLFLTKMRQELKGALAIYIPDSGPPTGSYSDLPHVFTDKRSDVIVMMLGRSGIHDYPEYTIKYEFVRDQKAIRFSEYQNRNQLIREGIFLGGNTQILGFHCQQTSLNEQILYQKHKVDVEVEYFDVGDPSKKQNNQHVIPLKAEMSVYPRPVNMGLRIDVPQ